MFPRNNWTLTKGNKGGNIKMHCVKTSSAMLLVKTTFPRDMGEWGTTMQFYSLSCFVKRSGRLHDSLCWEVDLGLSSLQELSKESLNQRFDLIGLLTEAWFTNMNHVSTRGRCFFKVVRTWGKRRYWWCEKKMSQWCIKINIISFVSSYFLVQAIFEQNMLLKWYFYLFYEPRTL